MYLLISGPPNKSGDGEKKKVSILDLRRFIDTQIRVKFCGGRVERGPEGL